MQPSLNELSHLGPRDVAPYRCKTEDVADLSANLDRFGIGFEPHILDEMYSAYRGGRHPMLSAGMDADLVSPLLTPSINTPLQFLQVWLPGLVFILTQPRRIDELVGITTQGRWEDEEIVQGVLERTGNTALYGDQTNVPLSSWVNNWETRTIIRSEEGMTVGRLEEARGAAMQISSAESKRSAAAEALEITRNFIGFSGFNGGANRTFGLLNDPNLPAYVTTPGPNWNVGTFLQITGDIRSWVQGLRTGSNGRVDPGKDPVTLGIAQAAYDFLSVTSDFGNSVAEWLRTTYPNIRAIPVPEFDLANGGENVAYLYAEGIVGDEGSTDDKRTFVQVVPAKFQTLGVEQRAKLYVEDYSNATAGILTKRPFAVFRASGI